MKKYIMFIVIALFVSACGNQSKKENAELTAEEETAFVMEESEVIDVSVNAVDAEVGASEKQVEELLKDI